jgi:hypothetical protein
MAFLFGGRNREKEQQRNISVESVPLFTSNTVAFYSMHNGDTLEQPKPIDFKNANVQPVIANDVFDKMSSRFFISRRELTGDISFPTVLHVSDKKNTKPDLFHGANIYFRGNEEKGGNDVEIMKVPNPETDIKWSSDAAKKTWTYKFVTEPADPKRKPRQGLHQYRHRRRQHGYIDPAERHHAGQGGGLRQVRGQGHPDKQRDLAVRGHGDDEAVVADGGRTKRNRQCHRVDRGRGYRAAYPVRHDARDREQAA